jgi:hypothetical protein
MADKSPLAIVQAWQEAANKQDIEGLLRLSDSNIEIIGPRGSGYGHQLLREWLGRAGLSLKTVRAFARGQVVVLAQQGVWRSVESGEVMGEQFIASHFRVDNNTITQYTRYDKLETALAEAGLEEGDEVFNV